MNLKKYVIKKVQAISCDIVCHKLDFIGSDQNLNDNETDSILKKIKETRFGGCIVEANANHFGIVFKTNLNGYKIYFLFDYVNGYESSMIGMRVSDPENRLLSSSDIIDFIGFNPGLDVWDNFLLYKLIGEPVFASKENIFGTIQLFDNDHFSELIKRVGNDIVKLITKVHFNDGRL